jgi:hypothetical protein
MLEVVRQEKRAYQAFAEHGLNPAMSLLSTTNYQIYYMLTVAAGVRALRKFEEQNGRLESVATIDNVDPFSMLTGKEPVKGIQIAYDHTRTVPTVRIPQLVERFSTAEGILVPLCPVTDADTRSEQCLPGPSQVGGRWRSIPAGPSTCGRKFKRESAGPAAS